MILLIRKFSHIILGYRINSYLREGELLRMRAKIFFKDESTLEIKEYIFSNRERKYSYHWMDNNQNLLVRWDNAEHWKKITTFPHHKHIKSIQNVESSFEINLEAVLKYIEKKITEI